MKKENDAKVFNTILPSSIIPKIMVVCHIRFKVAVNMKDLTCLLETVRTVNVGCKYRIGRVIVSVKAPAIKF